MHIWICAWIEIGGRTSNRLFCHRKNTQIRLDDVCVEHTNMTRVNNNHRKCYARKTPMKFHELLRTITSSPIYHEESRLLLNWRLQLTCSPPKPPSSLSFNAWRTTLTPSPCCGLLTLSRAVCVRWVLLNFPKFVLGCINADSCMGILNTYP